MPFIKSVKAKLKNMSSGAASDSMILTFVKFVTMALGLVITKLLSTQFSRSDYGTYAQAIQVSHTVVSLTILGLTNATSYYYNKTEDKDLKRGYVQTIFGMEYIIGLVGAILIMALNVPIALYFGNDAVKPLLWFVAFMPLMTNLINMLQVLFVSVGKAKVIAVRNLIVSLCRLAAVAVACFVTKSVIVMMIATLVLDVGQVLFFMITFAKHDFAVLPKITWKYVPEILKFCLPMAVYVLSNSLMRDIDKYVIGYFASDEVYAVYYNASKVLPFDVMTTAFATVLVPIITRQINSGRKSEAAGAYREYLRFGYLTTWLLTAAAIVSAKPLMTLLYDEKYLDGLTVFILYLVVEMIRFANITTVLSASGKTVKLMTVSVGAMLLNAALDVPAYLITEKYAPGSGIVGPAAVTVFITALMCFLLILMGKKELGASWSALFDFREIGLILLETLVIGAGCMVLGYWLDRWNVHYFLRLLITSGLFVVIVGGLNFKKILGSLRNINKLK
ncbi:MAG: oligosaccharide flippase family protein [Clostridia bacterium]|nr:oligosaccharide flippase family protein [Clostridia bacterium]